MRILESKNHVGELMYPALPVIDAQGRPVQDEYGTTQIRLPAVLLPAAGYSFRQRREGKVPFAALTDLQVQRLESDQLFLGMLRRGTFRWRDDLKEIPLSALTEERRAIIEKNRLEKENAALRHSLHKAGLPLPEFIAEPEPTIPQEVAEGLGATDASVPVPDAASLAETNVSIPDEPSDPFGVNAQLNIPGTRILDPR